MSARLLVVDDNPVNRRLACELLRMEGFEVDACDDAESAIEYLDTHARPDLVLMDVSLPGMDGLTLTRKLKADPRFASMPIVAITAFAMKGDEAKALDAGCVGYVTKPVDTRKLPKQIAAFIEASAKPPERLRIMIVEDHRIDLALAGENATLSGHVVISNTTAEAALAELDQSRPDVVLLDLNLPGMDGLEFVRRTRADPKTAHLPIVAITAYPDTYLRTELLAAGCAAYLIKPIASRELMEALATASGTNRTRS